MRGFFLYNINIDSQNVILSKHHQYSHEFLIVGDIWDFLQLFSGPWEARHDVHIYFVCGDYLKNLLATVEVQQMKFQVHGHHEEKILLNASS